VAVAVVVVDPSATGNDWAVNTMKHMLMPESANCYCTRICGLQLAMQKRSEALVVVALAHPVNDISHVLVLVEVGESLRKTLVVSGVENKQSPTWVECKKRVLETRAYPMEQQSHMISAGTLG
jgi:hypothetical protein